MTDIETLLKLQWDQLLALGVVVTLFTQMVKGIFKSMTGNWVLIAPLLMSTILCFYVFGFTNPLKSLVATILTFGISVTGWQTLKGSTAQALNGQNK